MRKELKKRIKALKRGGKSQKCEMPAIEKI